MTTVNGKQQFLTEVFPAELDEIRRRRAAVHLDTSALDGASQPAASLGLVGLALSGGGIRSATISLGVIQALARQRLLKMVDYLSTVSGGGYIGSCLSSLLNTPDTRPEGEAFPFRHVPGIEEAIPLRHLRNSGNYLAPGGILNTLRIPALLLRGILLNLFTFLPYIMLAVVLTELIHELGHRTGVLSQISPLVAGGFFLALVVTFPLIVRLTRGKFGWSYRNGYELLFALALLVTFVSLLLLPIALVIDLAIESSWDDVRLWVMQELQHPFEATDYWKWLLVIAALVLLMLANKMSTALATWGGKLGITMLGMFVPLFLFGIYLLLCVLQIDSPFLDKHLQTDLDRAVLSPALQKAFERKGMPLSPSATITAVQPGQRWQIHNPSQTYTVRRTPDALQLEHMDLWDGHADVVFFSLTAALLLFNLLVMDVNMTSAHGFYRDRLSKAYLMRLRPDGDIEPNDTQRLSDLNQPGTTAPYHLINVALNLQASRDPNLRGRNADFFFFSKHFTGSIRTGFCRTAELETYDPHVNLGTAMAISGAAASPNMGSTTIKRLVFFMTFLNIRLGYWLSHPAIINTGSWYRRWRLPFGAGPGYLLREALSKLGEKGLYVNISDGGHVENLGIYELLRRRCKLIIAVDGEADEKMGFPSLVRLLRFARIDMGIQIDIDLSDLRLAADGLSRVHWMLGTIHYSDDDMGYLLYIKSSLIGDEHEYIREYRSRQMAFPHEPTADQFFDETQFEAYRALGYLMAKTVGSDTRLRAALSELRTNITEVAPELHANATANAVLASGATQPA
jgi:hypothetical protein